MSETQPNQPENVRNLKLVTVQEEIQLDVVELLEDYLELAKSGQITCIAIAALKPGTNAACYGFSALRNRLAILGAVTLMQQMMGEDIRANASDSILEEESDPSAE